MPRAGVLAIVALLAAVASLGASGAARAPGAVYTGYAFETCHAPALSDLAAWRTSSPYRALGIYIGGADRACPDGNLSPAWVSSVQTSGWSLFPLYVGRQAPCLSNDAKHARISAASASSQGTADADDAVARAGAFGLLAGSPIYFDMEAYPTKNAACAAAVQTFLSAWVARIHARGYIAGVYGSGASTMRDVQGISPLPDDVWIADWSGTPSLFGNPWVSDALWASHQRIHQFKGGHKETYGGVTLNIDSDYADAAAVGPGFAPPPAPKPPPPPTPTPTPAPVPQPGGSVGSGDGAATASWPLGAIPQTAAVTLAPTTPAQPPPGYSTAGYALSLSVADAATTPPSPVTVFAQPLTVRIGPRPGATLPYLSTDGGVTWIELPHLDGASLPSSLTAGFYTEADGTVDVLTLVPGLVAVAADVQPPPTPAVTARFLSGALRLSWQPVADAGGIAAYQVLLDGTPTASVPSNGRLAVVRAFLPGTQSVYRVRAVDASGNLGTPSQPFVVVPAPKPAALPRPVPRWAWALFGSLHGGTKAPPRVPRPLPAWYRAWAQWRLQPFRLRA